MRLSRLWTVGVIVGLIVLAAAVATACSSSPKAAQALTIDANTVMVAPALRIRQISVFSQAGSLRGKAWSGASRCTTRQPATLWITQLLTLSWFPLRMGRPSLLRMEAIPGNQESQ